ncbi:uncharacterized protein LOC114078082 [Solanum pennellii]|nr:uncharacterized protein LOC114078082 [Solanum pennellii]
MNTVSKELLSGIVYASDAAMVWEDLKERFDKVDGSRVYQLHRDICTIHQGNLTVSAYFTKLRLLWDEFDALVPPPSCNCDRSRIYVDHMHYLRLFAFLMGLSEIYGPARSQILMMNPLPTVGKAYAMIVSDENQRITSGLRNGGDVIEATTLYANRSGYGYRNTDRGDGDKGEYNRSGYGYRNTGRGDGDKGYNSKKKVNWNLFCEHCKLHGHTKNICYKLVGYPEDWKFKKKSDTGMTVNKGKGIANNVQVDRNGEEDVFGVVNEGDKNEQGSHDLNSVRTNLQALAMKSTYTPDQYRKIMKLLNEEKQAEVNMAGPLQWRGEGDW